VELAAHLMPKEPKMPYYSSAPLLTNATLAAIPLLAVRGGQFEKQFKI